jgi:hypothetical protein
MLFKNDSRALALGIGVNTVMFSSNPDLLVARSLSIQPCIRQHQERDGRNVMAVQAKKNSLFCRRQHTAAEKLHIHALWKARRPCTQLLPAVSSTQPAETLTRARPLFRFPTRAYS